MPSMSSAPSMVLNGICSHSIGSGKAPTHRLSRAAPVDRAETVNSTGRAGVAQKGRPFREAIMVPV